MNKKIRVAVLYGGRSGEHEVSLVSAGNVIQNLDRSRFEVIPIGIDREGSWFLGDDILKQGLTHSSTLRLQREAERLLFNPDSIGRALQPISLSKKMLDRFSGERLFDVVFPVIHGTMCEDGTVQGLLELADVPYVGCGVLASAVGMDKDVSKRLAKEAGLNVPPFVVIKKAHWLKNANECKKQILSQLQFPIFVKPANTGSSVGVHKVKKAAEMDAAIHDAFQYDTKLVIEQGIDAIELEIAVLESLEAGSEPLVSVVGEVRPGKTHDFYSYAAKYLDENGAELIIPAPHSSAIQKEAQTIAQQIFNLLDCEGMARVDLFLERNSQKIYFNEINTIPGFTEISMYPKLMAASGMTYSDLLTHLVMLAVARHANKSKLAREHVVENVTPT